MLTAPALRAVGLLTAWGNGGAALPVDALTAAGDRAVLTLGRPAFARDPMRGLTLGQGGVYDVASVEKGIGVTPRASRKRR